MKSTKLTVAYTGPALDAGTMDVRDLAPALLGLAGLVEAANRVLNAEKAKVAIHVKATRHGSFEMDLTVLQSMWDWTVEMLTSDKAQAIETILLLLFGDDIRIGLVGFIRKLRNAKLRKLEDRGDTWLIQAPDGTTMEVPTPLIRLASDLEVRRRLADTLKPLEREGVDAFEVRDDRHVAQRITSDELETFRAPEPGEEVVNDQTWRMAFTVISPTFKDDNKWRLHDGTNTVHVAIRDEAFLRQVNDRLISFTKDDVLFGEVRVRQIRTAAGLRSEYELLKVLEHRKAERQLTLMQPPGDED